MIARIENKIIKKVIEKKPRIPKNCWTYYIKKTKV